jgi:hypothetical protein
VVQTRPFGSIIGAIAGLVFVLVNAGAVPASLTWRIVAIVVFAATILFAVVCGTKVDQVPPSRAALRTYGISDAAPSAHAPGLPRLSSKSIHP